MLSVFRLQECSDSMIEKILSIYENGKIPDLAYALKKEEYRGGGKMLWRNGEAKFYYTGKEPLVNADWIRWVNYAGILLLDKDEDNHYSISFFLNPFPEEFMKSDFIIRRFIYEINKGRPGTWICPRLPQTQSFTAYGKEWCIYDKVKERKQ